MKVYTCNKNCNQCKQLNIKTDKNGYPWAYECMKIGESIFEKDFESTKEFIIDN